jgi:uncharacterized protein YukE
MEQMSLGKGGIDMSKQDGYSSRTAVDLERKYNFGRAFAEVYGLISDAQRTAQEAQNAFDGLNHDQIFNLLTDYGKQQGIYRDDNGDVYVNASYIKGGKILANNVEVEAAAITGSLTVGGGVLPDNLATSEDIQEVWQQFSVTMEGVNSTVQSYETTVQGYEKKVTEYEQTVEGFSGVVESYESTVDGYAGQVSEYKAAVDGYSANLESYQKTVSGYTTQVAEYKSAVDGYSASLQSYETTVSGYTNQMASYEASVNGFSATLSKYSSDVDGYAAQVASYAAAVDGFSAVVEDYEKGLSTTLKLDARGVYIVDQDGETVEIQGSQIKANTVVANVDVQGAAYYDENRAGMLDLAYSSSMPMLTYSDTKNNKVLFRVTPINVNSSWVALQMLDHLIFTVYDDGTITPGQGWDFANVTATAKFG